MSLELERDPRKARSNYRKHSISFAEAVSVFSNPVARIFPDEEHAVEEPREIIIGHSAAKHLFAGLLHGAGDGSHPHYQRPPRHEGRAARL
jgi:uncharacterized DUF497 family protein